MNKTCSKCKTTKPLDEFRNQKKGKFGKKNYCKICDDANSKELYEKNKQYRIMQVEEWNEENPDKLKSYQKKWREKE